MAMADEATVAGPLDGLAAVTRAAKHARSRSSGGKCRHAGDSLFQCHLKRGLRDIGTVHFVVLIVVENDKKSTCEIIPVAVLQETALLACEDWE